MVLLLQKSGQLTRLDGSSMVLVVDIFYYPAICLGPLIIIRKDNYTQELLNHEYIHRLQQIETLFIFGYLIYAIEYLIKLLWYRNFKLAYKSVSFEREAFLFQNVIGYCGHRKPYSWIKYINLALSLKVIKDANKSKI